MFEAGGSAWAARCSSEGVVRGQTGQTRAKRFIHFDKKGNTSRAWPSQCGRAPPRSKLSAVRRGDIVTAQVSKGLALTVKKH